MLKQTFYAMQSLEFGKQNVISKISQGEGSHMAYVVYGLNVE